MHRLVTQLLETERLHAKALAESGETSPKVVISLAEQERLPKFLTPEDLNTAFKFLFDKNGNPALIQIGRGSNNVTWRSTDKKTKAGTEIKKRSIGGQRALNKRTIKLLRPIFDRLGPGKGYGVLEARQDSLGTRIEIAEPWIEPLKAYYRLTKLTKK
ncbi:MAG: hypothetical protein V1834_00550 [Candidatus Micrarchaeota archaeon]